MKQKIYLLGLGLFICLCTQQSFAQSRIQVGLGVVRLGANLAYEKSLPSVPNLGVGIYGAVTTGSLGYGLGYLGGIGNYRRTDIHGGVRAAYHFNEALNISNDKLDLYGAFGLGIRLYTYGNDFGGSKARPGLSGLARIGGNYQFNEKTLGFGEIGWGPSWITAGIAFDLGK